MSVINALPQSGGGKMITLWTNANPTSQFTDGQANLSDSITNYKYIGIKARKMTTSGNTEMVYALARAEDIPTYIYGVTNSGRLVVAMNSGSSTNITYARQIWWISNTALYIGYCGRFAGTGAYPTNLIPQEIFGIK